MHDAQAGEGPLSHAMHRSHVSDAKASLVTWEGATSFGRMSSLDPHKLADDLVRIGEEAIAKPDDAALDAYFAADFVFHGPDGDATLDELKQTFAGMRDAFTGFAVEREMILVQGDTIAARTVMSGVFEREYVCSPVGTVQPTGEPVSFVIHNFFRYDDEGRLAEEWIQTDNLGLLRQLGVDVP